MEWVIMSCFLIIVILLLRALLGNRISARLRYAMWLVVLLRLLIPMQLFTLPELVSPARSESWSVLEEKSIYVIPTDWAAAEDAAEIGAYIMEDGSVGITTSMGYGRLEDGGKTVVRYAELLSPLELAEVIWKAGAVIAVFVLLVCNIRFSGKLRRCRRVMQGAVCSLPVYLATGIPSPCLFGLIRPSVYVTEELAGDETVLRHVLLHEEIHYRHLDHIWCVLRCVALAVHWWNPLVWIAVVCSKRDGELACDESVLKLLGDGQRRAYGETLLRLITAPAKPGDLFSCATTMTGDKKSLYERIGRIACRQKQVVGFVVVVIFVAFVAAACSFGRVDGAAEDEKDGADSAGSVDEIASMELEDFRQSIENLTNTVGPGAPVNGETVRDAYETITGNMAEQPFALTMETAAGERSTFTISSHNGYNVEHVGLYLPVSYDWYQAEAADWTGLTAVEKGLVLTFFDHAGNIFRCCSGSDVVCVTMDGELRYLRAVSNEGEETVFDTSIFGFMRMAADDAARSWVWDSAVADGSNADLEEAAALLARQVAENYLALPDWVKGKPQDAFVEADDERVFDVYWGKPAQFCCNFDFRLALDDDNTIYWQAGAGLGDAKAERGSTYYEWGCEAWIVRDTEANQWRIKDRGSGGYTVNLPGYTLSYGAENYLGSAPLEELFNMILLTEGFTHDYLLPMLVFEKPADELGEINTVLSQHTAEEQKQICACLVEYLDEEYAVSGSFAIGDLRGLLNSEYHKYLE